MRFRRVHLVGIGGAGMSAIARVLLDRGVDVSGSDLVASPRTEDIARRGGRLFIGHQAGQIGHPDCVVVSSAVPADNPEVAEARRRGIPVWPRARMLGELMAGSRGIAVAGTHGKTTTTSMIGFILTEAGFDPTVIIGGELPVFGSNARVGRGPFTVAEADESDRSLLMLNPYAAVVTNVEEDHLENFTGIDDIRDTFAAFLRRLPPDGLAVLWAGEPRWRALAEAVPGRVVLYALHETGEGGGATGAGPEVQYRGLNGRLTPFGSCFALEVRGRAAGNVSLRVPGRHNMVNALAALAMTVELGVPLADAVAALARFEAPRRRFEVIGDAADILVVDDYAHHPTEVRAALAAARTVGRRVVAVFQPHRYSRTQKLGAAFARCFDDADLLVVTDVYPAGEKPIPGVGGAVLARHIEEVSGRPVLFVPDVAAVTDAVIPHLQPGDLVITMGAGNIRQVATELVQRLQTGDRSGAAAAPVSGVKG